MKDGTRKILGKAIRSLESARALLSEGAVDLAAGRGYYAMLYAAKAWLYEKGVRVQAHARIVDAFGREVVGAGDASPSYLDWMGEALRRRAADLESEIAPSCADVEVLVERAGRIVAEAARHLAGPSPES